MVKLKAKENEKERKWGRGEFIKLAEIGGNIQYASLT